MVVIASFPTLKPKLKLKLASSLNSAKFRKELVKKVKSGKLKFTSCDADFGFRYPIFPIQEGNDATLNVISLLCLNSGCTEKAIAKVIPLENIYNYKSKSYFFGKKGKKLSKHPGNVEIEVIKLLTKKVLEKNLSPHIVSYIASYTCSGSTELFGKYKVIRDAYLHGEIENQLNVLIAEYIPGGTISEFIKTRSPSAKLMKAIIFQIVYTLAVLQKKFQFVHNDLHLKNILMSDLIKPGGYFSYTFNNQEYLVPNFSVIPKLWDFDFAMVFKKPSFFKNRILNIKVLGIVDSLGRKHNFKSYGVQSEFSPYYDLHFFFNSLWLMRDHLSIETVNFIYKTFPFEYLGFDGPNVSLGRLKHSLSKNLSGKLPTPASLLKHSYFSEYLRKNSKINSKSINFPKYKL